LITLGFRIRLIEHGRKRVKPADSKGVDPLLGSWSVASNTANIANFQNDLTRGPLFNPISLKSLARLSGSPKQATQLACRNVVSL
jgi:hypothetical protein